MPDPFRAAREGMNISRFLQVVLCICPFPVTREGMNILLSSRLQLC